MSSTDWIRTKNRLVEEIVHLGFPAELGEMIAKNLGSPQAMERMISYLIYVKPKSDELIVDEMLAICSDISAWKDKKASEQATAAYNEVLNTGFGSDGEV